MSGANFAQQPAVESLVMLLRGTPRALPADAPQPVVPSFRAGDNDIFLLTNERGGGYRSSDRGQT